MLEVPPPGPIKYNFIRYGLRFFVGCYLRVRVQGAALLPQGQPYLICFSHPNWVDPMALVGYWPDRRWIWIFGPREEDMTSGWRNRLIMWGGNCVPFRPERDDLLDTTRRAVRARPRWRTCSGSATCARCARPPCWSPRPATASSRATAR